MTAAKFYLPDVGEGLTEAEIVSWKVKPGDAVDVNQVLVEIETAKSLVELPSPYAGTVGELLVAEGETVEVGTAIVTIESEGSSQLTAPTPTLAQAAMANEVFVTDASEVDGAKDANEEKSGSVLVGYGTGGHGATRRRRPSAAGNASPAPVPPAATEAPKRPVLPIVETLGVIAKPPIRKLAKDLDVDLSKVEPTGIAGEVTRDDVVRHAQQASVFRNIATPEWSADREERIPVKGVRKAIATAMVQSAFSAPHVSVFVDVDATRTMEFVKRLKDSTDFAGVKVSPLLILAKAIIWAVRRNPTVNSTWTDKEIIVHHYVNLGIAAATPRGLIVPNVKEAQSMSLLELARGLEQLTLNARDGKTSPADMADGTITVTNIGVFGMDTGTPILNPGEVGIVALGTIKQKPWVFEGEVRPRFVTTLGASFDHRVVDGDVASRFLADVASIVEEPALLLD
ncbi:MAG: 2-oxo acid dehydrogenase subunit E2 [Microbacteriaceae bacterium]|nr:2-oxo acid dehydrogenase subunit E2 [Microbacteriaceae bacterium]